MPTADLEHPLRWWDKPESSNVVPCVPSGWPANGLAWSGTLGTMWDWTNYFFLYIIGALPNFVIFSLVSLASPTLTQSWACRTAWRGHNIEQKQVTKKAATPPFTVLFCNRFPLNHGVTAIGRPDLDLNGLGPPSPPQIGILSQIPNASTKTLSISDEWYLHKVAIPPSESTVKAWFCKFSNLLQQTINNSRAFLSLITPDIASSIKLQKFAQRFAVFGGRRLYAHSVFSS